MENLKQYIASRISLTQAETDIIERFFKPELIKAKTSFLEAGKTAKYIYFLSSGIVKGYQIINGKIIVEHLVDEQNFFASIESFMNEIPAQDYFETITDCELLKITKSDLDALRNYSGKWNAVIEGILNEHLNCKMERVRDFQTLTAKERYLKFTNETPNLALNVSIENIASYLGMEPQSLSRIRKEIIF
ncbi:Crp/Fnr family transcriptional regulator [Crocinitomix catalasitica]|uniref:Crp/Fnr family transcriptional regulator n=1 Tax=Crocinitomix catalasitica TaxID=184607 RepID=UPI0004845C88|nr:Crp/Fnr family transcriptional regulator [Crocinitomix catalasitica]